jgi:hypothetical protein
MTAGVIGAACLALLGVAAWLEPDTSGLGTHRQLFLAPCGWVTGFGVPCPTCGMTTAFACAADGRFLASLRAQPLGALLAVATSVAGLVALYVAWTGSALGGHMVRLLTPRVGWALLAAAGLAWAYKIAVFRGFLP